MRDLTKNLVQKGVTKKVPFCSRVGLTSCRLKLVLLVSLVMKKKKVLTGIKATGVHLGNWIGAIKPALDMAKDENVLGLYFIADYHALNSIHDGEVLKGNIREVAATWLGLGLDPEKTIFYKQSDVPEIMELSTILAAFMPKGLLNRAHAYKAKLQLNKEEGKSDLDDGVNMGLFTYPLLMTADILAFSADTIPVGEDNTQHLEIARDVASKFNRLYGETIKVPEISVRKGKLLPGIDGRKMSASYNNHIPVFLPEKKLRKMIMKIKTDSTPPEEPKAYDSNDLLTYFKEFSSEEKVIEMKKKYDQGIAWGEVKQELFEDLNKTLDPKREIYNYYINNSEALNKVLKEGALKARDITKPVLSEVKKRIGVL